MSYALRNTIILMVTLLLLVGGAFSYIKFIQQSEIEKLTIELDALNTDYAAKVEISNQYPPLLEQYNKASEIVSSYDKQLYKFNDPDDVYDYLSEINDVNLELFYDFTFIDSVSQGEYGIVRSRITGAAIYADFVTFINKLENSALLNKVSGITIRPAAEFVTDDYIDFTMQLSSYYQKINFQNENPRSERFRVNQSISVFNPIKPLITRNLPENLDNLPNIEQSRLLGLTSTRVFIIDQTGQTRILKEGDKVFLGFLNEINVADREVIFNLNKGGIQEQFTLKVER